MKKSLIIASTIAALTITSSAQAARDHIDIVGSSTVFPFSTVVAETYGKNTGKPTPKIESTGTGGGMKLFCKGEGIDTPDITNASRRIKSSEFDLCMKNGVTDITEVLVGFDGITFANAINGPSFNFSLLVNAKMLTNKRHAASTETVPMRCREKVRPAVTDKLTSVRRCVTNE